MKNNARLFKWSGKIVETDSKGLIVCFGDILGQFWVNFGPILAKFRPKMVKYDPVKPISKIFM